MLLKPIDKNGNQKQLPNNARTKIIFLAVMIVIGALVVSQASRLQSSMTQQGKEIQAKVEEVNPEPTIAMSLNELKDEGTQLLDQSTKKSQEVLGEATRIATKPAEIAQDYIYEITIEESIKKLWNMLPERRKEALKEELLK